MKRRAFLEAIGAGGAWAAARRNALGGTTRRRRPNIIVIMSDEHNVHVTGCYGNNLARTPHLDRIARQGIVFDAAYTNAPLCVPSRLSFTAGKYASRVSAWNNSCWLPRADYPSLPRIMNDAGYESVLCGKMHYDRERRYGFREIGGNMNGSRKTGRGRGGGKPVTFDNPRGDTTRFNNFHPGDDSNVLRHDRKVTAAACDFLASRTKDEKPFFLIVGYLAPHFPLIVPQEYWDHYRGTVRMPRLPEGHLESQVRNYRALRHAFRVVNPDPAVVRKGRELYYGLTEWLDNEIGKVLRTLAASDFAEDTVLIYTTDHGENMGEHGLWWKNCMYEHAARVPLIVRWPARWKGGQRRSGACSLVDVGKTVAELGGATAPADWNGDSLCPVLDDPEAPWKNLAVSEYYAHNTISGFAMIRMGTYKYVYHTSRGTDHPAQRELYDLAADPGEFTNLAGRPEHADRVARMHAALVNEIGEDPETTEKRCLAETRAGYPGRGAKKKAVRNETRGTASFPAEEGDRPAS
jgi:choline-sulfatase